jgi:aspartyl protease family protein
MIHFALRILSRSSAICGLALIGFLSLGNMADGKEAVPACTSGIDENQATKTSEEPVPSTDKLTVDLSLKVSGSTVNFSAERDLSKGLTDAANLKKKAKLAIKPLRDVQQEITNLEGRMLQAHQQMVGLNAQLANVNDVASNNRLVGAINTLQGQITLAEKSLETLKAREISARSNLNNAREEFVQQVLDLGSLSVQLTKAYESSADSPEVQASLKKLREDTGKDLTLQPSSTVQSLQRKLAELQASVQTERIPLRRDDKTFYASVVINGKHTAEMVVDTGASLVSLPYELAVSMGLKPEARDKQILLTIADGSTITAHLKTIQSVRVGTFVVENVECAVLGPEAVEAHPLLGMSFLGEFQFHLDAAAGTLGLTQIESDSPAAAKRRK